MKYKLIHLIFLGLLLTFYSCTKKKEPCINKELFNGDFFDEWNLRSIDAIKCCENKMVRYNTRFWVYSIIKNNIRQRAVKHLVNTLKDCEIRSNKIILTESTSIHPPAIFYTFYIESTEDILRFTFNLNNDSEPSLERYTYDDEYQRELINIMNKNKRSKSFCFLGHEDQKMPEYLQPTEMTFGTRSFLKTINDSTVSMEYFNQSIGWE